MTTQGPKCTAQISLVLRDDGKYSVTLTRQDKPEKLVTCEWADVQRMLRALEPRAADAAAVNQGGIMSAEQFGESRRQQLSAQVGTTANRGAPLGLLGASPLGVSPLGAGMSMADKEFRSAIAKLADDLERIKRAQGVT